MPLFLSRSATRLRLRLGRRSTLALATAALAASGPVAQAQAPNQDEAQAALTELRALVTESTGVVGDLQPMINSGKVDAARVTPAALAAQFRARYAKATQGNLEGSLPGLAGETRQAFLKAFEDVVTRHQAVLAKGGQDAFVPAYYRARVLATFNASMKGRVQGYATNRDDELINSDWAVGRVMKGSTNASEVSRLMGTGGLDAVVKRQGDMLFGYWPMKLGPACVSCHAQNGLQQQEGAFGGALVAEVKIK